MRTSVPETSVDEYSDVSSRVGDIGFARDLPLYTISGHVVVTEGFPKDQFGLRILSFVGTHAFGSTFIQGYG